MRKMRGAGCWQKVKMKCALEISKIVVMKECPPRAPEGKWDILLGVESNIIMSQTRGMKGRGGGVSDIKVSW